MNNKLRFIVLTIVLIIGLPATILVLCISWLADFPIIGDYVRFYRDTWRQG